MTDYNESYDSEEFTPKVVSFIVAVVVFACVLVPLCTGFASGENGGSSGPESVTVSNEQYVLSKMAYGTNPVFDITPSLDTVDVGGSGFEIYQTPVLYADAEYLIYMDYNADADSVYHITGPAINDNLNKIDVSFITNLVSDGHTVTVTYFYGGISGQTSFDIASPCYYTDPNGEYGVYINPSAFSGLPVPSPLDYTFLYIPDDYTPHTIASLSMALVMGYDTGHIWGVMADIYHQPVEYYNISNNQITDAGWELEYRLSTLRTDVCPSLFMILPNSVTYTPADAESPATFTTTLKDLYGDSYPWTTVSDGYIRGSPQYDYGDSPTLRIDNPDFKQMPWETGQTTLDSWMNPEFWSIVDVDGEVRFKLDLIALAEYYQTYEQILLDCYNSAWPNPQGDEILPAYMIMTDSIDDDHPGDSYLEYISPIGIVYGEYSIIFQSDYGVDYVVFDENTYTDISIMFYNGTGVNGLINADYHFEWIYNGETYTDDSLTLVDSVLFLGESETGYIPLSITPTVLGDIPYDSVNQYVCVNMYGMTYDGEHIIMDTIDVADTVIHNVLDMDSGETIPVMYDYSMQTILYPDALELGWLEYLAYYTSLTEDRMDIDYSYFGWYENGQYLAGGPNDASALYSFTLAVSAPAEDNGGGNGGNGGISGPAGTLILTIPVFGVLGLMMYMLNLFGFVNLTGRFD